MFTFGNSAEKVKAEYRKKALNYFNSHLHTYEGNGALAWFSGAVELAEELGIISYEEAKAIGESGAKRYEKILAKRKAEMDKEKEQRKAERAAKAKQAKTEK